MLPNKPDGETDVVVHMKEIGNKEYKNITKDTLIGTTGQNRRLEAIRITGHALRLEAIRINPYGKTIKATAYCRTAWEYPLETSQVSYLRMCTAIS